ncbi:phage tail protein [Pseudodesulfovibrio sp.]|uniref:phage tail protein n=1 Tax=unclassified Pseudodesulfovibrio TaxID=2661612 RepID=UPI003AFF83A6
MGVFKDYFFKTLHWPLIFRPGPLAALVEGLARAMDEVRQDIIWLRNQFNPWTCEPEMIPLHAASRGLVQYASETDKQYRERCIRAFAWQRLGGGQLGMPQILAHTGYPGTEMLNVRHEDPERWAEFKPKVPVPESGLAAKDFTRIAWTANETKPARSKLAGIQAASSVSASVSAGGITFSTIRVRLTPERTTAIRIDGAVHGGGYTHTVARVRA